VIGDGAYVAAGSTVTGDVASGQLAVARGQQRNINGWVARKRGGTKTADAAAAAATPDAALAAATPDAAAAAGTPDAAAAAGTTDTVTSVEEEQA
jgi:bifunctional UDP-N-acetylglucosamine pyrophosphorylase/glucosamine-1-phosphate N-acetyltransferase